jgi:DNA-binding FadR family transcriptional regulator
VADRRLYPSLALHGRVAHQIGRRIVSGQIPEGALLPREAEFADEFDVSRQAVREGLKVLAAKNLVASRRRTGTHVLPRGEWNLLDPDVLAWHSAGRMPPKLVDDLIELRRLIEPAAAALAAERRAAGGLAEIAAALDRMEASGGEIDAFNFADAEFHAAIFAASGNDLIDRLSTILRPLLEATFSLDENLRSDHAGSGSLHRSLYEAIRDGLPDRARADMNGILDFARAEDGAALVTSEP